MSTGTVIGYGIICVCLAATGATAVSGITPFASADEGTKAALRHVRRQANYITSGAGTEQVQAMSALADKFNLRLLFAASGAERYPAHAKVAIQDDRGSTIVDAVSDGPLFYARLPDGLYRVMIKSEGQTLIRIVNLQSGRKANLRFYWPSTQLSPVRVVQG